MPGELEPPAGPPDPRAGGPAADTPPCDLCGAADTAWVKCKLICRNCRAILMTCGDL